MDALSVDALPVDALSVDALSVDALSVDAFGAASVVSLLWLCWEFRARRAERPKEAT